MCSQKCAIPGTFSGSKRNPKIKICCKLLFHVQVDSGVTDSLHGSYGAKILDKKQKLISAA